MTKVKAQLKNLRISPRKVQLVASPVRGKTVAEALTILDFDLRHSAAPLAKLIRSAQANAVHNAKMAERDLIIEDIAVGAGPTLKRWRPRAYGRASKILKRTSRVTVVLRSTDGEASMSTKKVAKNVTTSATKKAPKKTPTKATKKPAQDDLTKIEGIGPKIAQALASAEITTFAQLAKASVEELTTAIADVRGVHDPATWAKQATLARDGKWDALQALQEELIGGKKQ